MARRGQPPRKFFLQRDYTNGTAVRFSDEFPTELRGRVSESDFKATMDHINEIFDEAEALSCRTYAEGCLACVTGYLIHCCCKTHYEKCVEKVARYIDEQNRNVFEPKGIVLGDPMDRGLRCIEVNIYPEDP